MITLSLEVVSPDVMPLPEGGEVTTAGINLKHYITTQIMDDNGDVNVTKTEGAAARVKDLYEKFGLDYSTFDNNNPNVSPFIGKTVWALLKAERMEKRRDATQEQKAKGELGSIIKDPITGKDQIIHFPKVESFYGEAQV